MIIEESTASNPTSPETPLRRRRSLSSGTRDSTASTNPNSSIGSDNPPKLGEKERTLSPIIKENENVPNFTKNEDSNSNVLFSLAGLVMAPFSFLNSLINSIRYVIWLIYTIYMLVTDPFGIKSRVKTYARRIIMRITRIIYARISPSIGEWLKENRWKLGLKCGWGLLWLVYVCVVLLGLLVVAFVMGNIVIKGVVVEPMKLNEPLSFDYAQKSPVAYVPLSENLELGNGARVIPVNHKIQITVSLKLPESDYNRNLGMFQVRADFLASDNIILASLRRPCMLQFKSGPLRLLSTFLNVVSLLTGYTSESQNVNIHLKGFTESKTPTSSLMIYMEPRAEFQNGAGIPEIYSASLTLESQHSLLKRTIWYWRKLLLVWISMTMFVTELVFVLLCCSPLIIPRVTSRVNSATSNKQKSL